MSRYLAPAIVLLAIVASGVGAGLLNHRWGSSSAVQNAVVRLKQVPLSLNSNWDVQAEDLNARVVEIAELDGYLQRRYIHRSTGAIVSVLLVCGRSGPISVHTPDVCYTGAGYVPLGNPKSYKVPGDFPAQFEVRDFRNGNAASPTQLRIFYAWGAHGKWSVPSMPRVAFSREPALYKLYAVRQMNKADEPIDQDLTVELLSDLMPQLQQTLFTGS